MIDIYNMSCYEQIMKVTDINTKDQHSCHEFNKVSTLYHH